jgi:DNA-binding Xre family transcriptional regulator
MGLRYYKLFDLLQRRDIKKGDLMQSAGLSWPTMSKLSKGLPVNSEIISRICAALNCQPGDIMEYLPEEGAAEGVEVNASL